jgi:hypothetical protein
VGDDEIARVDGLLVAASGQTLDPSGERQQRRVAVEVRRGAGRRFREIARGAPAKPRAREPEGENLIGVDGEEGQRQPRR